MRPSVRMSLVAALCATAISAARPFGAATAQVPLPPAPVADMVQEDWRLVVGDPDPIAVGPQVTTVMSPNAADTNAAFAAFDMNYLEFPVFFAGGMQVQVWSDDTIINASSQLGGLFNTTGEAVTWTQKMWLAGGTVGYDVDNGQSTTWGQFGQGANLRVGFPTRLASLAGYNPDDSAKRSGASWESDRVTSLTLLRVRYYARGVLIQTDDNPRVIIAAAAAAD